MSGNKRVITLNLDDKKGESNGITKSCSKE